MRNSLIIIHSPTAARLGVVRRQHGTQVLVRLSVYLTVKLPPRNDFDARPSLLSHVPLAVHFYQRTPRGVKYLMSIQRVKFLPSPKSEGERVINSERKNTFVCLLQKWFLIFKILPKKTYLFLYNRQILQKKLWCRHFPLLI